jgi:hypothetical protein
MFKKCSIVNYYSLSALFDVWRGRQYQQEIFVINVGYVTVK